MFMNVVFDLALFFGRQEAAKRHGVRAKIRGEEIFRPGRNIQPRILLKMENYPKVNTFCSDLQYSQDLFMFHMI
jgi:hypothetical protein